MRSCIVFAMWVFGTSLASAQSGEGTDNSVRREAELPASTGLLDDHYRLVARPHFSDSGVGPPRPSGPVNARLLHHSDVPLRLGRGFNPAQPTSPFNEVCVVDSTTVVHIPRNEVVFESSLATTQRELHSALGIDAALSAHYGFTGGSFSAAASLDYDEDRSLGEDSLVFILTVRARHGINLLRPRRLVPHAQHLLSETVQGGAAEFLYQYGTHVVEAEELESSISALIEIRRLSQQTRQQMIAAFDAAYEDMSTKVDFKSRLSKALKVSDSNRQVRIRFVARGGAGAASTSALAEVDGVEDLAVIQGVLKTYIATCSRDTAVPSAFYLAPIPELHSENARALLREVTVRDEKLAELYYIYQMAYHNYRRMGDALQLGQLYNYPTPLDAAKRTRLERIRREYGVFLALIDREAHSCFTRPRSAVIPDPPFGYVIDNKGVFDRVTLSGLTNDDNAAPSVYTSTFMSGGNVDVPGRGAYLGSKIHAGATTFRMRVHCPEWQPGTSFNVSIDGTLIGLGGWTGESNYDWNYNIGVRLENLASGHSTAASVVRGNQPFASSFITDRRLESIAAALGEGADSTPRPADRIPPLRGTLGPSLAFDLVIEYLGAKGKQGNEGVDCPILIVQGLRVVAERLDVSSPPR